MSKLHDRGKALEDKFFQEQESKALSALREQIKNKEIQAAISDHTGISDDAVLAAIVQHGISVESFIAIRIIPLVLMSWASGSVESAERATIHSHMFKHGIKEDSPVHTMVDQWLSAKPDSSLEEAWSGFVQEYKLTLSAEEKSAFANEILGGADDVASAAGGFLGFGSVCDGEEVLINRLRSVLQ